MDTLLWSVGATGAGSSFDVPRYSGGRGIIQAHLSNTTTPNASIDLEVSLDGTNWVVANTFSLTTANESQGYSLDAPWLYIRGNVTSITGTSAAVDLLVNWHL